MTGQRLGRDSRRCGRMRAARARPKAGWTTVPHVVRVWSRRAAAVQWSGPAAVIIPGSVVPGDGRAQRPGRHRRGVSTNKPISHDLRCRGFRIGQVGSPSLVSLAHGTIGARCRRLPNRFDALVARRRREGSGVIESHSAGTSPTMTPTSDDSLDLAEPLDPPPPTEPDEPAEPLEPTTPELEPQTVPPFPDPDQKPPPTPAR
jgi:hypothetical protein